MLGNLHHPHVLRLFGVAYNHPYAYIVTEQCSCSLLQLMKSLTVAPAFAVRVRWAQQIAYGMDFLHEQRIIHRRVDPAYLLLLLLLLWLLLRQLLLLLLWLLLKLLLLLLLLLL